MGDEYYERESFKVGANVFDFRHMRATDLPFNQRINVPKHVGDDMEIKMFNLKGKLQKITEEVARTSKCMDPRSLKSREYINKSEYHE